jgi:hypothetical protein
MLFQAAGIFILKSFQGKILSQTVGCVFISKSESEVISVSLLELQENNKKLDNINISIFFVINLIFI